MACIPTPHSLSAGNAPNGALAPPCSAWHRLDFSHSIPNQLALAASQDTVQILLVEDDLLLGTSHEHIQPESSLLRLPIEVLDEIFSYAKPSTLARLALVCHTFEGVATRLLYRHIPALSLSLTTRCLETLVSKPSLAAHTRTWEIGDTSFLDASRKGRLSPTFFKLLQGALHNTHRLTELGFLLNGATSHVLLDAPFRLTKLTAYCDFDATFGSWLTEQTSLCTAIFCGNFTSGVTLPSDALPLLRRVAAAPLTLACVVPGRPVREVDLCLVHPWSLSRDVLQKAICTIASSTGPLDSLKIISHLSEPSETVLSALEAIPSTLKSISKLALHAVSGSITNDILAGLPPVLSQFASLKSLTLFSKNKSDALHVAASLRTLAATWRATCASLESVTFADATYVHHQSHGWVTPRDLAELLTVREQTLQYHTVELCKQEVTLDYERRAVQGTRESIRVLTSELLQQQGGASVVTIAA